VPDTSKPTVTVNLTLFVGSRHEDYGEKGMAHLLEHLLFKETKRFKDIKKALTEKGADANGTTWYDRTNYYETLAASDENLKWALSLEADRLVNTIITKEKLAPEMTVVRNEFEMGENSPQSVLFDRVMSAAFTWHNYGGTTIGARSDIETVPQERLQSFYTRYYQPDNALLVVAGKFEEAKALEWISSAFGSLPKPKRALPTTYTVEPVQDGERAVTVRRVGGTPSARARLPRARRQRPRLRRRRRADAGARRLALGPALQRPRRREEGRQGRLPRWPRQTWRARGTGGWRSMSKRSRRPTPWPSQCPMRRAGATGDCRSCCAIGSRR
jgi:predicted Zn-dependent peptidase